MSKEHGRERVPPAETEEMINSALVEAAMAFGLPGGSIKKRNIHIANEWRTKSDRIVLHN